MGQIGSYEWVEVCYLSDQSIVNSQQLIFICSVSDLEVQ